MKAGHINILDKSIEKAKKGDAKAFAWLYDQYAKAMFNVCMRMTNSREDAEDVLQEAFTDAFRNIRSFGGKASFGTWLKRIVVNKCVNALNKKSVELVFSDEEENYDTRIDEDDVDDQEIELKVEMINKALTKLPDGYRTILTLHLFEGFDHREISQILNISESTSKTQYMRARKKLKEIILNHEKQS